MVLLKDIRTPQSLFTLFKEAASSTAEEQRVYLHQEVLKRILFTRKPQDTSAGISNALILPGEVTAHFDFECKAFSDHQQKQTIERVRVFPGNQVSLDIMDYVIVINVNSCSPPQDVDPEIIEFPSDRTVQLQAALTEVQNQDIRHLTIAPLATKGNNYPVKKAVLDICNQVWLSVHCAVFDGLVVVLLIPDSEYLQLCLQHMTQMYQELL